uniref:Uncharacterized protein n=1 Tax=Arundo donax TaxID=35708 RepID=A0A0A9F192_ARUDO
MLILNRRSIGGWEALALNFMYAFYLKSLYQALDLVCVHMFCLSLLSVIMDNCHHCI